MTDLNKQHQKLIDLQEEAELCTNREEAQQILKKAAKARRKIQEANDPYHLLH